MQVSTDTTCKPDWEFWSRDAATINGEDRPLVESQRPIELPLNVRNEMHIPADRMSIEYRKALVEKFGLGRHPADARTLTTPLTSKLLGLKDRSSGAQ